MARPKKKPDEKLDCRLPHIRCTFSERSAIEKKAAQAGMSLSEYVRTQSLKGRVVVKGSSIQPSFELVNQLRKIGTNVNQIAKNMNIYRREASTDHKEVWKKLNRILDQVIETMP